MYVPDPFKPPLRRRWPLGPNYLSSYPNGTRNYRTWAEFKLTAASWYLLVLEESFAETGDLDRFVGVEMAIDGFLSGCSSSFDAAVSGLIQASERRLKLPVARQVPPYQRSWAKADALVRQTGMGFSSRRSVLAAMAGPSAKPKGWLQQLRQLRNRTQHENTLTRALFRTAGGPAPSQPTEINVPGYGQVEPLQYFRTILPQLIPLIEAMVTDAEGLDS